MNLSEMNGVGPVLTRRFALCALGSAGFASTISSASAEISDGRQSLETANKALRAAMVSGDEQALKSLLHDQLKYMHSSGYVQSKSDVLQALVGRNCFASLVYSNEVIDVVGNVAVVVVVADQVKNIPGGRTRASRIKLQCVWIAAATRWQLLSRTSALIQSTSIPSAEGLSNG